MGIKKRVWPSLKRSFNRAPHRWITLTLLLINGLAWLGVAMRVDWVAADPVLHPEIAEIRQHWLAKDALGESFTVVVTDQMAAETIAWLLAARPNVPLSHPQVEFHKDRITGRGLVLLLGLRTPVFGTGTVSLVDGKPIIDVLELGVADAQAPGPLMAALQRQVDQAQASYDALLTIPVEITYLELREGEVYIEGVYR